LSFRYTVHFAVVLPWERMYGPIQQTYPFCTRMGEVQNARGRLGGPGPWVRRPPRRTEGRSARQATTGRGRRLPHQQLVCLPDRSHPGLGRHAPPDVREASRTRVRSARSWYTHVWTNLFSPPTSLVQQAARGRTAPVPQWLCSTLQHLSDVAWRVRVGPHLIHVPGAVVPAAQGCINGAGFIISDSCATTKSPHRGAAGVRCLGPAQRGRPSAVGGRRRDRHG